MQNASVKTANDRDDALISSGDALAMLGVKPQTLYAYVSRGLIRAAPSLRCGVPRQPLQ